MIERYLGRISGPLLERIDIHLEMARVGFEEMIHTRPVEDSATVRGRVMDAWERQQGRFGDPARGGSGRLGAEVDAPQGSGPAEGGATHPRVFCNAQMGLREIREHCRLSQRPLGLLRMAMGRLSLSPRAFHRVQRLARTIADVAGCEEITEEHVAEAISYRLLDRGFGALGL